MAPKFLLCYKYLVMKLEKNTKNYFTVSIVIGEQLIIDSEFSITYFIDNKKKYLYLIQTNCEQIKYLFPNDYLKGDKGFGQHIIGNEKFYLVYKEKNSIIELITFDNSIFINGHKK